MPKYTISVTANSASPSLTMIADVHKDNGGGDEPLLYDDVHVRPVLAKMVRLEPGDYVLYFDVQNGKGMFTITITNESKTAIASQQFTAPPLNARSWYFSVH